MSQIFWIIYTIVILMGYEIGTNFYTNFDPISWGIGIIVASLGLSILDMKNYITIEIEDNIDDDDKGE